MTACKLRVTKLKYLSQISVLSFSILSLLLYIVLSRTFPRDLLGNYGTCFDLSSSRRGGSLKFKTLDINV